MRLFILSRLLHDFRKTPPHNQLAMTTVYIPSKTLNLYSPPVNQTQNLTTYIQKLTFHTSSSLINTTEKSRITIRNKFLISLLTSLLLIIACTGLSYCILIYFKHYLNMDSIMQQDLSGLNRISVTSSEDSNDTQLQICNIQDNILPETINQKNEERYSLTDLVKLFRY